MFLNLKNVFKIAKSAKTHEAWYPTKNHQEYKEVEKYDQ